MKLCDTNMEIAKNYWEHHKTSAGLYLKHWHPHYEILLIHHGICVAKINDVEYYLQAPSLILYRPFTFHEFFTSSDDLYDRSILHFGNSDLMHFSKDIVSMDFLEDAPMLILSLELITYEKLNMLFDMLFEKQYDFAYSRLYLIQIIKFIADEVTKVNFKPEKRKQDYIGEVLHYVTSNISDSLKLEETARMFGIGRTKLNKDIKEFSGMTYKQTVTEFRMTLAREMIEDGKTLTYTALECGYNNESHFIQTFKKRWGMTPMKFQRDVGLKNETQ